MKLLTLQAISIMNGDDLDKVVQVNYGTGTPKQKALVKSYYDQPVFILETMDGDQFTWAASLCEPLPDVEQLKWWKEKYEREKGIRPPDDDIPRVKIITYRYISDEVWIYSSFEELEVNEEYICNDDRHQFKVLDQWKPDSLYRHLVKRI